MLEEEIRTRIGIATSAMTRLDNLWSLKGVSLKNRLRISKAVAWATLLYGCESWTISKKSMDKLKAFEMKCYRRLLKITWKEKKTNDYVRKKWRRFWVRNQISGRDHQAEEVEILRTSNEERNDDKGSD